MRRCMTRWRSPSRSAIRYFPRRRRASMRRPSRRALDLLRRHGSRPERVEHLRALDRAPRDARRELAADRLYLGELGHALSVRGERAEPTGRRSPAS